MMINFDDPELVKKFGSWARVQVEFYDFLFEVGTNLCAGHWKEAATSEVLGQFKDGGDLYERSVRGIESAFTSAEDAWARFRQANQ